MASGDERLEQNQREFRYANRRLEDLAGAFAADGQLVPFLCECADDECLGRISITIAQYGETHSKPNYYVVLPGHPRLDGEVIIEDNGYYEVVQKGR